MREREIASAQRPVAQQLERIVDEAASELERLVEEVRRGWTARIAACEGIEMLRAEVAAIEDGAAHRLSLVCDELREKMTVQFVRLVLEQSRSLRQDLLRKRHEVARGRSPKVEETFDDLRLVLPASLDRPSPPCARPISAQLMTTERSLFDPIFSTVAREKRQCSEPHRRAPRRHRAHHRARALRLDRPALAASCCRRSAGSSTSWSRAHAAWLDERLDEEARADAERVTTPRRRRWRSSTPLAASESRAGGAARGRR